MPPRRPPAPGALRRRRAVLPTLLITGALLVAFSMLTGFYTDLLWYRSVGYSSVFTKTLGVRAVLFLAGGLLFAAAVAVNLVVAYRARPIYQAILPGQAELDRYRMALDPFRRLVVMVVVTLLGLIAGSSAASQWRTFMQWRHGESFGQKDAQFGKDISFFAFDLPWYQFLLGFALSVVVVSLIAAAVTHYLYGGLRLQPLLGERATPAARVHLSVLVGLFVLLRAVGYWLDRYGLAVGEHRINKTNFTGLTYTDVNAVLQGKTILAIISVLCAALFFANIARRTWLLPGIGVGLLLLSAVLVGGIYPALVQRFQVVPNEADREAPYIRRNIEATRLAYGINDIKTQRYATSTVGSQEDQNAAQAGGASGDLRREAETTAQIRLLDPQLVSPTFRNLQQFRPYYDFVDLLDVDRYMINGERRDTVGAVRELNLEGVPSEQRNWINDHTVYTHGFGFVAGLGGNTQEGEPVFVSSDIPPEGQIEVDEPRVYFGEESPVYSIVGGAEARELDFPDDDAPSGIRRNSYDGEGGVAIDSLFRRLLFATKYQEANLLLSDRITDGSKILFDREPKDRISKVAPWLTLDRDPYPAVIDGRILWIVDGYTTSNGYPYSTRSTLDEATADSQTGANAGLIAPVERVNYIRNSVKATVDAYDGTVRLYAWDENDPVLKTWQKTFPGTVQPRSAISDSLMEHLRYPEDLFKVQRTLLAHYHVSSPKTFYSGADFWRIPDDPTAPGDDPQPPYYMTLQMPGQEKSSFSITSTYVPTGNRENAAAFVAVNADPVDEDYGTFRVLQLPRSSQVNGPSQVQNQLESDDQVADQINILKRGTNVSYGNLLTIPVGDGLLYVEPVYVQADNALSFPLLRKVLVSYGDNVAFEDSLGEALDQLFGEGSPDAPPDQPSSPTDPGAPGGEPPATGDQNAALAEALADAEAAIADAEKALAAQDFAAYGEAQQRLREAIERAVAAQRAGGQSPGDGASPASTPSPSG